MFDSAQNKRLFLKNNFLQDIFADPREICLKAAKKFIVIQSRKDLMIWNMLHDLQLVLFLTKVFFLLKTKKICDALRDLVPFGQFKKREKHPWRSVTYSKVAG